MEIIYIVIALVISLSVHEFAHAYTAMKCGDPTPKYAGRVTLNPAAHLDPLGTLMIFVAHFGWGKPVPVNQNNLRNPRWHMLLVSLAGPLSNFILALISAFLMKMFWFNLPSLRSFFQVLTQLNVILMVFNLLPIPPLDGSKVILALFPPRNPQDLYNYLHYGPYLLLGIVLFSAFSSQNILWRIMGPLVDIIYGFVLFQS